jgi:hypothetical protein
VPSVAAFVGLQLYAQAAIVHSWQPLEAGLTNLVVEDVIE